MSLVKDYKQFMLGIAIEQAFSAYEAESTNDTADFNSMVKSAVRDKLIEVDISQGDTWVIRKLEQPGNDVIHPAPVEFSAEEIAQDHILRFFHYAHLPAKLQERSKPFAILARLIIDTTPRNPERTVALRKLLESKDAAVRAAV